MRLCGKPLLISCLALNVLLAAQVYAACNPGIQLTKPDSIYVDNFDGTVVDTETGLIWAKCSLGQNWVENIPDDGSDDQCSGTGNAYTWEAALEAVQVANSGSYLGHADWRLPNKTELESIVESACFDPAINSNRFPSTNVSLHWASSVYAGNNFNAWVVDFGYGSVGSLAKNSSTHIRVVRGGQ